MIRRFKLRSAHRIPSPVCWLIITLNLLLILGCSWFYLAGYTLDCRPDRGNGGFCALRNPAGGGRSLQVEESGISYWRWRSDSLENTRVWAFRWRPYVYEDVILPGE